MADMPFAHPHSLRRVVQTHWYLAGGTARLVAFAIAIAAGVFFWTALFHWLLDSSAHFLSERSFADVLAAVVVGYFSFRHLTHLRARRRALVARLEAVGELNHQIRNALDVIGLSAQLTKDDMAISFIRDATLKISDALRDAEPDPRDGGH